MTPSKAISVRLDDETHAQLDGVCAKLGISKSQFVTEAIEIALENELAPVVHVPIAVEQARIVRNSQGKVKMPMRMEIPRLGAHR